MHRSNVLASVDEVIEAFGGATALAAQCNVSKSHVESWVTKGFIPNGWQGELEIRAQTFGKSILAVFFEGAELGSTV